MTTSKARRTKQRTLPRFESSFDTLERRLLFARLVGIDVSTYQPNVNWTTVASVKDFAIVRATAGLNTHDSQFLNNVNATTGPAAKGMYVGFYHYAYYDTDATHTAIAEADNFFDYVKPYLLNDGKHIQPMLDIEQPLRAGWTGTELSQWITDWCNRVASRGMAEKGLYLNPIIYAGAFNAGGQMNNTIAEYYPNVIPTWPTPLPDPQTHPGPSSLGKYQDWSFWQYAGGATGTCPGVGNGTTTPCDLDVFKGGDEEMKDYIIGSPGRWTDGTWVQTTTSVKAWAEQTSNSASPWSDTYTTVASGMYGKVLQGPFYGNSYMRYQVQFTNGVTGWAAASFMSDAVPTAASSPNVSGTIAFLPTNFSWTGPNASSYDVYLDGVKKTTVTTNSWTHPAITTGAHTWQIVSHNGINSTTGPVWNFTYTNTDATSPTYVYGGQQPVVGAGTFDFTVTYTDSDSGIDASSLGTGDLTVTGPNGFSQVATFISATPAGNGSPLTATYRLTAPGGTWDTADNGNYTVTMNATQVRDLPGNYAAAGTVAVFGFSTNWAYLNGNVLMVTFDGSSNPVTLGKSGFSYSATRNGTTLLFSQASVASINVVGTSSSDNLQIAAALTPPMTFSTVAGNDTVTVTAGTINFNSDFGIAAPNATLIVNAGATALFNVDQNLKSLQVDGTATLKTGSSVSLVTKALTLNGKLNLNDGALVYDYGFGSYAGTFSDGSYDGYTGMVVDGRNGGSWDGNGLITGMTSAAGGNALATLGVASAHDALGLELGQTASWMGVTVDYSALLVRYTFAGDANLDGKINGDDYFKIDAGYSEAIPSYAAGDFDMNGVIDADDYFIIDSHYNKASVPLALAFAPSAEAQPSMFASQSITSTYEQLIANDDALSNLL